MTQDADIGWGAEFHRGDGADPEVFAHIGEVVDVVMPKESADAIDSTHSKSPSGYREFIKGLLQLEEFTLEIHYNAGGTAAENLKTDMRAKGAAALRNYRAVAPGGVYLEFAAMVIGYDPGTPTADKMVLNVTFRPSGAPTDGGGA
ncbi:phage tail tube protein [Ponticoccus alexandrii]|uniref:Lambda phage tail tube protein N-terminal domain-containing protein n=1 Tax=Ponticoccus alexandrii TaxID=1943633 RepID=A0ABX7F783_9RHOB|nr:phage tail tube protein [Ponticoccus alexandrii]QRF66381.1 hypothetical protein GQA70_08700 [Ponticoccus alexandrii]